MKPATYQCLGHETLTSTNGSDTKTATIPAGTSAIEITVETTACRVTFTAGGDPTSSTGLIVQKDQMPWFLPIGQGIVFKAASIAGTASVIQLAYLQ